MNAYRNKPFFSDGGKAERRLRLDHDDVAGNGCGDTCVGLVLGDQ
jgi:hypothetical protein